MKVFTVNNVKIYCQGLFPFPGFLAMALYGVIFWRNTYQHYLENPAYKTYVSQVVNHESIHKAQMQDFCKFIPIGGTIFYLWYLIEWLIRLFVNGPNKAYRMISFEQEAYEQETNLKYLEERKKFNWLRFITKKSGN